MEKHKIVFLATNCKNTGPINQTLNIIKHLDKNLFEPVLITLFPEIEGNSLIGKYKAECSEVYCMNMNKYLSLITGKQKLKSLLKNIKPSLVHGVGMPPYTMSLGYKASKHLVTLRNYCYEDYPAKYGKVLGPIIAKKDMNLIQKKVKKGETFVTCSKSLSDIYMQKHGMKFDYIRNGVDISKYVQTSEELKYDLRNKLKLPLDKTIAIYTGQFIVRKNQRFALEGVASSKYRENLFSILLGDGPELQTLREYYKDNANILFTGQVPNVEEYLQASDLYISTSMSEGLPNGVLEAMSVGLSVLLSDIPQHREIFDIDPRIGAIYKSGDKSGFVFELERLMANDLFSAGLISHIVVKKHLNAERMSKCYQKVYSKIIDRKIANN